MPAAMRKRRAYKLVQAVHVKVLSFELKRLIVKNTHMHLQSAEAEKTDSREEQRAYEERDTPSAASQHSSRKDVSYRAVSEKLLTVPHTPFRPRGVK